jgi:uncharacterized protein
MFGPEVSIIFVPTFRCNCNCAYCFEPRTPEALSPEQITVIYGRIARYLASIGVRRVDVYWQGGEVMVLSPEWCRSAARSINSLMRAHHLKVQHFLQTNLMDYSPDWDSVLWEFFDGMLGSSLDYPNVHRRFKNLVGDAYNRHWIDRFREASRRGMNLTVISVPNEATLTISPQDFYRYYTEEVGLKNIQINMPFASGPAANMRRELLLDPVALGDFLAGLLEIHFSRDDRVILDPFQGIVDRITRGEAAAKVPCFFCPNCVNSFFCVGPSGEIGQCDAWVGSYPHLNFGNLLESDDLGPLLASPARKELASRPAHLLTDSECLACKYFSLCNGGCPVRTKSGKGTPNSRDPYCETYKRVFACIAEHVHSNRKLWSVHDGPPPAAKKQLVWGWPEPGAVVFSSFVCTNNCIFCAPAHDRKGNPADLDDEIFAFIDDCAAQGMKTLFFTGAGEPTLNRSLVDYVRRAREHGIENMFMFTNGCGMTEKLLTELTDAGMENFWVSLHGLGEIHDHIVRRNGSFVEAYRALSLINSFAPKRLNVNTCLNVLNIVQIEWLLENVLRFSHTTAHCLCLPEWDGNAYENRDLMCRLERLKERLAGITAKEFPITILDNVPYCVAPHLPHIGNIRNEVRIKRDASDSLVSNADNMGHNETPPACRELGCMFVDQCVGVDRRYLAEYGDGEIRPIRSGG